MLFIVRIMVVKIV